MLKKIPIALMVAFVIIVAIVSLRLLPASPVPTGPVTGSQSLGVTHTLPSNALSAPPVASSSDFATLWVSDFSGDKVRGLNRDGHIVWEQYMAGPPIPPASHNVATEYVTVAPSGNLIVADGEGMMVQEIDRLNHKLVWQYGVKDIQGYKKGYLHQPDKAFKINDREVLINDGNNRRVIIIDQKTNDIVWQYGETLQMGSKPGLLRGNTSSVPFNGGQQIIITDTLEKKIMLIDRATKKIIWEWTKPDAKWIQHVFPTPQNTFILEDRQKDEVFEVSRDGKILWTLSQLADGSKLHYPTDTAQLSNGNVLIAEAGRGRVIEINPHTKELIKEYKGVGFGTTLALDPNGL